MTTAAFILSWLYDKFAGCPCAAAPAPRQKASATHPLAALGDDVMFGKPEWFRKKKVGWGLTPITWQGWVYTFTWAIVMVAPFLALLATRGAPEAGLWLTGSVAFLMWDVRKILQVMRGDVAPEASADDDMLYITNDDNDPSSLATRNYDMHVRR